MAGQADGSIIVDTELNSDGFKAGSAELLAAIKSLSNEVKNLGKTLRETFGGNDKGVSATDNKVQALEATISSLQAEVESLKSTITELEDKLNHLGGNKLTETPVDGIADTAQGADAQVTSLQAKIRELEGTIAAMQSELEAAFASSADIDFNTDAAEAKIASLENKVEELERTIAALQAGGATATPPADFSGTSAGASNLQRQVESVSSSVSRLEMTFQRAMGGSETAMGSFVHKVSVLDDRIDSLQAELAAIGQTQFPTQEYVKLSSEVQKLEQKYDSLLARQEKMQAMGVKMDSAQWKSLQYDMEIVSNKYHELIALKQQLEASGTAFQTGADTSQYQHLVSLLEQTIRRLEEMRAGLSSSSGAMTGLASGAKSVFSWISRAASAVGGSVVSGIRSASAHMAKLVTQSKLMKRPLESMSFMLRRIAPSLLMTEGIFGLLRKAVNAFLQENEHLTSKLNACWAGIGNILGPIITRLIDLVATAVSYVTSFLGLLGAVGKGTTKAISSAGKAAEKQTDKLKGQLTSIDELNVLQTDENSDSSSAGGVAAPEITLPDWAKLIAQNLKSGDWSSAARILAEQFNRMFRSIDWARLGRTISNGIIGSLNALTTAVINIDWQALGNSVATCIGNIDWSGVSTALFAGIGAAFGGIGAFLWGIFEKSWNSLVDWWFDVAYEDGEFTVDGLLLGILEAIENIGKWIVDNIFTPFIDGFKEAFGIASPSTVMKDQGGFIIAGLLEGLTTSKNKWSSIGSNICSGIADGISDGWNWLKKKVQKVAQDLLDAAKSALGIHSPSKLFRDTIGLNIGYGVGEGIEAAEGSVLGSVAGVADAIAKEFNANEYSIGGVVSNAEVDGTLTAFSDKIAGSFASLMDRLQAIADGANFTVPSLAQGKAIPYTAQADRSTKTSSSSSTGNEKIVSDISEAVYAAVLAAMRQSENNGIPAFNLYLDGRQITAAVEKRQGERGLTMVNRRAYGY